MLARVLLGAQVHSFDPSPTGEAYISRLRRQGRMPDGMHYHKLGIADRDGEITAYAPAAGDQYTRVATSGRNGEEATKLQFWMNFQAVFFKIPKYKSRKF